MSASRPSSVQFNKIGIIKQQLLEFEKEGMLLFITFSHGIIHWDNEMLIYPNSTP